MSGHSDPGQVMRDLLLGSRVFFLFFDVGRLILILVTLLSIGLIRPSRIAIVYDPLAWGRRPEL